MISTRNLTRLPDIPRFRAAFQSMAMLDAIIMPEWEYRYYSFEVNASPDGRISIGSMRNGSGDDLDAIFSPAGCLIRGFAHEFPMTPYRERPPQVYPGVLEDTPAELSDCFAALHPEWWELFVTFCIWRLHSDSRWHHGPICFPEGADPDGSEFLLSAYDGCPETYLTWAEEYYHPSVFPLPVIRAVFEHCPVTEELIHALNSDRSLTDLSHEIEQIGYGKLR